MTASLTNGTSFDYTKDNDSDGTNDEYYNDTTGLADPKGLAYSNGYAYVLDGTNGLVVFSVTNAGVITHEKTYDYSADSEYNTPGSRNSDPHDIWVEGNYAYIADGENGLVVIDISTPDNPDVVDVYDYTNADDDTDGNEDTIANAIYVYNGNAYIGYKDNDSGDGIDANYIIGIDLSDPENIEQYNSQTTISKIEISSGTPEELYVKDDYIYVAAADGGLRIISLSKEAEVGSENGGNMDNVISIGGIWIEN